LLWKAVENRSGIPTGRGSLLIILRGMILRGRTQR
jgi:hypothetical protein